MSQPSLSGTTVGAAYHLRAIWTFARRELKLWTYFRTSFSVDFISIIVSFIIYMMVAGFKSGQPDPGSYGVTYATFLVLGLTANSLFTAALTSAYSGLLDSWWNNRLETLLMSPISMPVFVTGISVGEHIRAFIRSLIYVTVGVMFFGAFRETSPLTMGSLMLVILVFLLTFLACTGLGLAAASMIFVLDARGGSDPVRLIVGTLSDIAAGVYFPIHVLPRWMQSASCLVPQTYALDALRRLWFGVDISQGFMLPIHSISPGLDPLASDIILLSFYSVAALLVGSALFRYGLGLARKDGRLSTWR